MKRLTIDENIPSPTAIATEETQIFLDFSNANVMNRDTIEMTCSMGNKTAQNLYKFALHALRFVGSQEPAISRKTKAI